MKGLLAYDPGVAMLRVELFAAEWVDRLMPPRFFIVTFGVWLAFFAVVNHFQPELHRLTLLTVPLDLGLVFLGCLALYGAALRTVLLWK